MAERTPMAEYWRKNRILIAILLAIWALVSYVFAIFLAEPLYDARIGGELLTALIFFPKSGDIQVFGKLQEFRFNDGHGIANR